VPKVAVTPKVIVKSKKVRDPHPPPKMPRALVEKPKALMEVPAAASVCVPPPKRKKNNGKKRCFALRKKKMAGSLASAVEGEVSTTANSTLADGEEPKVVICEDVNMEVVPNDECKEKIE